MVTTPTHARVVTGTSGNDTLFEDTGSDLLTGAAGNDVFVISKATSTTSRT